MDEIRLPFTMKATVTYGDPPPLEPLPDPLPPGWIRIPVSFQVTLPAEVVRRARRGGAPAPSDHAPPEEPLSLVPHSLRIGTEPHPDGGRTWEDFGALFDALDGDPSVPDEARISQDELAAALRHEQHPLLPLPPEALPAHQDFSAFPIPLPPTRGRRGTGRFDMDRLAHIDLNSLGLGDTMRLANALRTDTPFTTAPSFGPAQTTIENDFPAIAGRVPPGGTGNRALDIVMKPGRTTVPPAIRTATSARTGTPDTGAAGNLAVLLRGMQ